MTEFVRSLPGKETSNDGISTSLTDIIVYYLYKYIKLFLLNITLILATQLKQWTYNWHKELKWMQAKIVLIKIRKGQGSTFQNLKIIKKKMLLVH